MVIMVNNLNIRMYLMTLKMFHVKYYHLKLL